MGLGDFQLRGRAGKVGESGPSGAAGGLGSRESGATRAASVIVPTFREAENIGELLGRLEAVATSSGIALEVILVDDDSDDGLAAAVENSAGKARLIVRKGERGLASAALAGVRAARHDTVVIMDGDLSHPPEAIPALVDALDAGAEMAIGSRFCRGGSTDADWTLVRRVNTALATWMARPFTRLHDPMSGFVAFRKGLLEGTGLEVGRTIPGYKVGLDVLVRSRAERIAEVPIAFTERRRGTSKLTMGVRMSYCRQLAQLAVFRFGWSLLALLALCTLVFLTFRGVQVNQWLDYDDRYHVLENPHIRAMSEEGLAAIWRSQYGNLFIPVAYTFWGVLAWVSERASPELGAFSPVLFQCVKPVLHAINAIFVFLILRTLGARVWGALLGAALFAVHPLQVESVAWISETRGLLAAFFGLAAAWGYLRWSRGWSGWGVYVCALVALALALLSKPSAITLVLIVTVLDVLLIRAAPDRRAAAATADGSAPTFGAISRRAIARSATALLPWFVLSIAAMVLTRVLQPGTGVAESVVAWWQRPLIAGDALSFYLGKLGWPIAMTPDYARTPAHVLKNSVLWIFVAWLIPFGMLAGTLYWAWRGSWRGFGCIALAGVCVLISALLPVLGLIPFDHQDISTVADRYMYLAMLGPAIIVAFAVAVTPRWGGATRRIGWERVIGGVSVLLIGILAMRSHAQVRFWRDDVSLWSHSLEISPKSATTLTNLGFAFSQQGRHAEAIDLYKRAIDARPETSIAHVNLAWSTMDAGRLRDAEDLFEHAILIAPADPRAFVGRGILYARTGRAAEAAASFRRATEIAPNDVDAHGNLGLALFEAGDLKGATLHMERSIALRTNFAPTWYNYGLVLEARGDARGALRAWERALLLDPSLDLAREAVHRLKAQGIKGGE